MKITRRKSRQRQRIYETIRAAQDHPSAQDVYEKLKKGMPSLSLGSVYRNIAILLDEGRILGGEFDGSMRFDAVTAAHYHFVCEKCRAVSDFAMPEQPGITDSARRFSRHYIQGHTIRFFGTCAACLGLAAGRGKDKKVKTN